MKKNNQIIAAFLLVCLLALPSCKFSLFEKAKPLSGEKTAQLISQFYTELGPRIGVHLVEPNAVITIAGLRGQGNFLMHDLTSDEKIKLEKINELAKKSGIHFSLTEDVKDEIADILILNFKGLEYSSKMSHFPFVEPFDSSTGYEGYLKWRKEVRTKAEKYFKEKKYISSEGPLGDPLDHLTIGLTLGYPDQALLDLYSNLSNRNERRLPLSHIAYSDYYENPQPNFQYLPEHENEKSILKIKESWGALLKEFYTSSWHTSISKDPTFIAARKSEEKAHDEWFLKPRL